MLGVRLTSCRNDRGWGFPKIRNPLKGLLMVTRDTIFWGSIIIGIFLYTKTTVPNSNSIPCSLSATEPADDPLFNCPQTRTLTFV